MEKSVLEAGTENLTPEMIHEIWMESRLAEGWVYGVKKDYAKKISPCLVPYDQLPNNQKIKDELFSTLARVLSKLEID